MSRVSAETAAAPSGDAAPLFAALGDETRLRLLLRLRTGGPATIARLSAHENVTRQAITKHVEVLSRAGLLRSRRHGRSRVCELEPSRLTDAHAYLDGIEHQWDAALGRLQRLVES